jgi:hypothetical protein
VPLKRRDEKLTTTQRVVLYLHKHGPSGCFEVGEAIDNRRGRISANGGGGDYAAQMLLGRMRKAGLVRVGNYDGSSKWELTQPGLQLARKLA